MKRLLGIVTILLLAHPTAGAAKSNRTLTVVAAGDIACDASMKGAEADDASPVGCHQRTTADIVAKAHPDLVLPLGDEQYDVGALSAFKGMYGRSWGKFLSITRPAPGNHEYATPRASGYYTYYGSKAGDPSKGYYSFDRGTWHFIALNANCLAIGGCNDGSPEESWLKADLAKHKGGCILAYWHQPRFSSGRHHSDATYIDFWKDLYAARADIVLNGHDHLYERFGPQTPTGEPDGARGVREFIVGTGGRSHYVFTKIEPNSEVRNNSTFGVLVLRLHPHSYDWTFKPEAGSTFSDRGSANCH